MIPSSKQWRCRPIFDGMQFLANLTIVLALLVAAATYMSQLHQRKVEASKKLIEVFYSEKMQESKIALFRVWQKYDMSKLNDRTLPESAIHALVERVVKSSASDTKPIEAIANLTSFFDNVQICITSENCDASLPRTNIVPYARDFYCLYRKEIEKMRTQMLMTNIGKGLEILVAKQGGCFE